MKKAKTIGITFGVAALAVAGGAALALNMGSVAKEVKADPATTRLYLDMSGFTDWYKDSATFKLKTHNTASGAHYWECTKVADAYYYVDVDLDTYAKGNGYEFIRYSSDGETLWNEGSWNSYSSGTPNTYFKVSGWNAAGTWSTDDQSTWKVAGATNGVWAGPDEDISISLTMRFNNEGLQFYSTSVTLAAGSVFKVQNVSGTNEYYGYEKMDTNSLTAPYFSGEGNNNITVVTGGTFELYMKPFEGRFWMQVSSETEATTFASSFLTATDGICSTGSTSANHATALADIWGDQCNAWEDLTLGAKNIFKTGTANATIKDAHDRYVHIMTRYNATLDPFEGGPSYGSPALNVIFGSDKSFVPTIVIVTACIGAIAAAAGFVFLRKKRNNA